ncbi:MAG: PaRep2b protein [Pyrobaculum sp.]|nr:PaRep2b protein [Pyrobaculum sp.]
MWGWGAELHSHYLKDENYKRALFYAVLALEEAFGVYRSALRKYAVRLKEAVQKKEVGEEPFKRVAYMPDLGQLKQLAEEESKAFENALRILRERLNEYAVKYGLGDLLNVEEGVARGLAEAMAPELSEFKDVSFGVKALATLIDYRERALGGRVAFGTAAKHWLEVGGSAWLLYYAPKTAYNKAIKARAEKPTAVEEMVAEAFRRLFLNPGADHYSRLVEELTKGGKLALMLEEAESSYVFRLEEGGGLKELGLKLRIAKVGEEGASIVYFLELDARWREFFKQELEAAIKAAEEVGMRLPVEDSLPYMLGWVDSDVAISRRGNERGLQMTTSHLWQLAETKVLFGWSYFTVLGVGLTLEGPKPQFYAYAPLDSLDEAIRRSAESGWLKMLGIKAESWDGLKQWVAGHWDEVIDAVKRWLKDVKVGSGFDLGNALEELEGLRSKLADDKTAREVIAPALLLIQAKRLGGGKEAYRDALRYFAAVVSGAVGGDGHVSSAMKRVGLASGKHAFALLWKAALAAYGVEAEVREVGGAFFVAALGGDAVKLARLYFLFGPPLLEGDDRFKNHKLAEAVKLGAEGLDIRWEGLRKTKSGRVAADLTISEAGVAVKYNVYLRRDGILLQFASTDRSHAELAARLLRLAGVGAEVRKESGRDQWYVYATTDMLVAGRKELRDALAEIVRTTVKNGLDEKKAEGWLEKLEKGRVLREGWPRYSVRLTSDSALEVKFGSTSPDSIEHQTQRLREVGLEEGRHFTVKMPEEGRDVYVYIRREGLVYAAWLSVYGSERQRELATEFVSYILQRAEEEGKEVSEKAQKIIEEGRSRGSLKLEGFEKEVEVDGREHVVKVLGGGAEFDEGRGSKPLLRIRITAEVDGVRSEYMITFGRFGKLNVAMGRAYARSDAPGGKEADAERLAALIRALTGREPKVYRMKDGTIMIKCHEGHLEGFMRYAELANHIMKWLEETGH